MAGDATRQAAEAQSGIGEGNKGMLKRIYNMPAGQVYVSSGVVESSDYYAKIFNAPQTYKVVKGEDEFYQISFNHRIAFVKKSDVELVQQ